MNPKDRPKRGINQSMFRVYEIEVKSLIPPEDRKRQGVEIQKIVSGKHRFWPSTYPSGAKPRCVFCLLFHALRCYLSLTRYARGHYSPSGHEGTQSQWGHKNHTIKYITSTSSVDFQRVHTGIQVREDRLYARTGCSSRTPDMGIEEHYMHSVIGRR